MAPLLEREQVVGSLIATAQEAAREHGSLTFISGEAGLGKTSVVRAMRAELGAEIPVLVGACESLSVPVPLAPLRELLGAVGGADLMSAGSDDRVATAASFLGELAARAPLVAVVEDAHWADPLTLDVLRIVARRLDETRVAVVVTYRDDEAPSNPPLVLLLGDLVTHPGVRRIALEPLSETAVGELAAGSGLDRAKLVQATGGNPFLITEAIAAGGRLPASVRDAALARAGRLSTAGRQVVDVAAIVGQRFDASLLQAVVGEGTEAVEEALARGVLVADEAGLGFRHDLIRHALEQSISPPRRAELHARVFAALAGRPERADDARLAHHAELGQLRQEGAVHAARAAAQAERVGALRETYLQADRALRLGSELPAGDRFELLVRYSRTSNFVNPQLEDGVDAAERAVALADEMGDRRRRGRGLMTLSYALWSLERVVEARTAAVEAVQALEESGDAESLAWAYATLARIDATSFDPGDALAVASRALPLARAAQLDEVVVDLQISIGLARGHRGEPEALQLLADALHEAGRAGFTIRVVRSYVNLMTVAVAFRDHGRVDQLAAEALPLLEEWHVSPIPIMALKCFRAQSLLDRGHWDEALAVAAEREPWWQGEFPVAGAIEGLIRARRGDPGEAGLVRRSWQELQETVGAEASRHGMLRLAVVETAWLRGHPGEAVAALRAARDTPEVARFARSGAELALWGSRFGVELPVPVGAPPPVLFELEGDWRRAIGAWRELQAPYQAALAALPGDERAARSAMATLQQLGATGAARAFARERSARGFSPARGPRASTVAHPAGLTRREQDVLDVLDTGASNAVIAAQLHLSERTVAHHVAEILRKLDVANRHLAVEKARRMGLTGEPAT